MEGMTPRLARVASNSQGLSRVINSLFHIPITISYYNWLVFIPVRLPYHYFVILTGEEDHKQRWRNTRSTHIRRFSSDSRKGKSRLVQIWDQSVLIYKINYNVTA
jgi:hypothetical protein